MSSNRVRFTDLRPKGPVRQTEEEKASEDLRKRIQEIRKNPGLFNRFQRPTGK